MAKIKPVKVGTAEANLFHQIYKDGKDATKALNIGLVERSMQRKLQSMYDDAQATIDDTKQTINDEYGRLNDCNFNTILEYKSEIRGLEEAKVDLNNIHEELFGVPLVETEE